MKASKTLLIAIALLLVLMAAVECFVWTRAAPVPRLSFIGYTNKPRTVVARVLFRNQSKVPLEILPYTRNENVIEINGQRSHAPGYHIPWPGGIGTVVQPGTSAVLDIHLKGDFRHPWWTEVCTLPKVKPSKLRRWAGTVQQPTLKKWVKRLFPPVRESYTRLGPFTNLPPGWVQTKDGSAQRQRRE